MYWMRRIGVYVAWRLSYGGGEYRALGGMGLEWTAGIRDIAGGLVSICIVASILDLLVRDESAAFGFRMICDLAIALCVLRSVIGLIN